jgi:hypothetical protein
MTWMKGMPANNGRPNGRPRAAYHCDGEKIVEHNTREYEIYRSAQLRKEFQDAKNISEKNREELPLQDPVLFQHKLLQDDTLPIGLRIAIAPYCHPKVGLVTMPRCVETPIAVPAFQTIEDAEAFLLTLSRRVGSGELPVDSANEVAARGWIASRRAGQEVDLKIAAASATGDTTIRIEGACRRHCPVRTSSCRPPRPWGSSALTTRARTRPRCSLLSTIKPRLALLTRPNDSIPRLSSCATHQLIVCFDT